MLKIHISNLQDGEYEYEFKINSADIEFDAEDAELAEDVAVNVKMYKAGNQFDLKTELSGSFILTCDRCTDKYRHQFKNSFEIIYKFNFSDPDDSDDDQDEIKFIPPKTGFIDIKDDIRDYLLLSIPMKKAPEEEDGICRYCKRSIDDLLSIRKKEEISPVWEKLIKIKKNIK